MNNIGNPQFHAMCEMWGVDSAITAAKNMGFIPTDEQIDKERKRQQEQIEKWDAIFKPKEG